MAYFIICHCVLCGFLVIRKATGWFMGEKNCDSQQLHIKLTAWHSRKYEKNQKGRCYTLQNTAISLWTLKGSKWWIEKHFLSALKIFIEEEKCYFLFRNAFAMFVCLFALGNESHGCNRSNGAEKKETLFAQKQIMQYVTKQTFKVQIVNFSIFCYNVIFYGDIKKTKYCLDT